MLDEDGYSNNLYCFFCEERMREVLPWGVYECDCQELTLDPVFAVQLDADLCVACPDCEGMIGRDCLICGGTGIYYHRSSLPSDHKEG